MVSKQVIVRRSAKALAILAITAAAALNSLLALFVFGMRCDEGCSDYPRNWHEDASAWQWDAQLAVAGVGVLGTVWTTIAIARGTWRSAIIAGCIAIAAWAIWWLSATGS